MPGNSSQNLSNKFSQSVSAMSSPWDEMCYFVNVTGDSIPSSKKNSCEVRKGITSKFIPAGGEVKLNIPQGTGHKLQLIGFERTVNTDPCPTLNSDSDLDLLDQTKLRELAVQNFDAAGEQTTVALTAVIPANDLKTQYSLASSCSLAGPATINVSDVSFNFGTKTNGSISSKTFTLTNAGGVAATTLVINGLATPYSISGGNCVGSLNAGATCTVVVDFQPMATGTHPDALEISFNDGTAPQSFSHAFTGSSAAPALLTISESDPFDFGTNATGSSTPQTFTVTNTGASTATAISINGLASPFSHSGGSCGTSLNSGNSCTVDVQFTPGGAGVHTDTLDITYNDGAAAQSSSRNLQGTGVPPAFLTLNVGSHAFGTVAYSSSVDYVFTLTNSGGVAATALSGAAFASEFDWKGGTYPGIGGTCGATIAPFGSCDLAVSFSPSVSGPFSDTVSVSYHNGVIGAQVVSSSVTGTGASPFTWTGNGGNSNFSNGANWLGGTTPATADVAMFTSICGGNCNVTISSPTALSGMILEASYTGTITVNSAINITITGNFGQYGGTFVGSSGNIQVNGLTNIMGGMFTAPSGILSIGTALEIGPLASHNHNNGRTKLFQNGGCGTTSINAAVGTNFYDVELFAGCSQIFDLQATTVAVVNDLYINASSGHLNNGMFSVMGDVFLNGSSGGTATVKVMGSPSSITGSTGYLPHVEIATSQNVYLYGDVKIRGDLISSGFNIDAQPGSTVVFEPTFSCTATNLNLAGAIFYGLKFNSSCGSERVFTISGAANVLDTLHFAPTAGQIRLNGGLLWAEADVYNDSSGMMGGSTVIRVAGSANQSISGYTGAKFPSIEIQKSGGTAELLGEIGVAGSFVYTSGTLSPNTSNVIFYALQPGSQIQIPIQLYDVTFKKVSGSQSSINISGPVLGISSTLSFETSTGSCLGVTGSNLNAKANMNYNCPGAGPSSSLLVFDGPSVTQTMSGVGFAPAAMSVNKNPGDEVAFGSAVTTNFPFTVSTGDLHMNGFNFTLSGTLQVDSGSTVYQATGSLTYGSLVGAGSIVP